MNPSRCQVVPSFCKGFTLFELLAVLTVVTIVLSLVAGSYSTWGIGHTLRGAEHTLEAGLQQARTLATTRGVYVFFSYGTETPPDSPLSTTTGFQSFICTNAAMQEADLGSLTAQFTGVRLLRANDAWSTDNLVLEPAIPFERLSRRLRLSRRATLEPTPAYTPALLIFHPDGSIFTEDGEPHIIALETRAAFQLVGQRASAPLLRLLRIDPLIGFVTHVAQGGEE